MCSVAYAVSQQNSKGREFPEKEHPYRTAFERDRDRIIHCAAFRRLEGKTQVFTTGLDDHYRTRMTHSIEVAQIGRTIAKALGLNDALTEAICLAHDLGHAPFGHTGEKVLNELLADAGGFEHNKQTLRIVTLLEHPYPDFMGLNLMYETRLALAKHRSTYDNPDQNAFTEQNCSLEGQVADLADRIAYNCHDLEDGQKSRLISEELLESISIFRMAQEQINAHALEDRTIRRTRTSKAMINQLVGDCIETSRVIIKEHVKTLDDCLNTPLPMIQLSKESDQGLHVLEEFLLNNLYMHKSLLETADHVKQRLTKLFMEIKKRPEIMPRYFQGFIEKNGLDRAVADYIAGMTDRFCQRMLYELT